MSTRKIKDGKVDGEKVFFKGHAKATFMSDGRTVEDAIKQAGTGGGGSSSGSGSAYPRINYAWTSGSETISPNTFHVWGSVTGLTIEFGEEVSGVANEYLFQFTSGTTPTSLTLPDGIQWVNGAPNINANKTYQVSVVNNIGLIVSV